MTFKKTGRSWLSLFYLNTHWKQGKDNLRGDDESWGFTALQWSHVESESPFDRRSINIRTNIYAYMLYSTLGSYFEHDLTETITI